MGVTQPLGATELHVLLVLADGARYGYAIMKAVEEESDGRISPEIGSLYRLLSRLVRAGLVEETEPPRVESGPHPGRERRYYRLTAAGRAVLRAELRRLREMLDLPAAARVLARRRGSS